MTPAPAPAWDFSTLTAAVVAILAILGIILSNLQTWWLRWQQRAAAAASEARGLEAIATAKLAAETAATAVVQATAVSTKLDGVVVQLDGKLQKWVDSVASSNYAKGVLEEKTRRDAQDAAVAAVRPPKDPPA